MVVIICKKKKPKQHQSAHSLPPKRGKIAFIPLSKKKKMDKPIAFTKLGWGFMAHQIK